MAWSCQGADSLGTSSPTDDSLGGAYGKPQRARVMSGQGLPQGGTVDCQMPKCGAQAVGFLSSAEVYIGRPPKHGLALLCSSDIAQVMHARTRRALPSLDTPIRSA